MRKISPFAISAAIFLALTGCGELTRTNPLDPRVIGGGTLQGSLVGSWSRDDGEKNEIYVFRADGRVELKDYFAPDGGVVDRNAVFPQTRVRNFAGTYSLVVNVLTISFTSAVSNDSADPISPPNKDKVVEIGIRGRTLTLNEADGKRLYTRLP